MPCFGHFCATRKMLEQGALWSLQGGALLEPEAFSALEGGTRPGGALRPAGRLYGRAAAAPGGTEVRGAPVGAWKAEPSHFRPQPQCSEPGQAAWGTLHPKGHMAASGKKTKPKQNLQLNSVYYYYYYFFTIES